MPNIAITVPETYENITRPVALEVARSLVTHMSIPSDVAIHYSGMIGTLANKNTTLQGESSSEQFGQNGQLNIEVSEEFIDDGTLTSAVDSLEHMPVFADVDMDVSIRPIYRQAELVITVNYEAATLKEAQSWLNAAAMRSTMDGKELVHALTYHYQLPKQMLIILHYLHELRESNVGYGETLKEWFGKGFVQRMTAITNLGGRDAQLTIPETQMGIMGVFDFENVPARPERSGQGSTYTCSFEYKIRYEKIIATRMQYPIVIHNQLIDPEYRDDYGLVDQSAYGGKSINAMNRIAEKEMIKETTLGYYMPEFEDWLPRNAPTNLSPILNITLLVDPDDPRDVINLKDLGEYELDEDIIAYMEDNPILPCSLGESPYVLTIYEGKEYRGNALILDSDLNLRTTFDMEERKNYHLVISLYCNLGGLSARGKEVIRNYPIALAKIIDALDPTISDRVGFPKTVGGKYVPASEFNRVVGDMRIGGGGKLRPGINSGLRAGIANYTPMQTVGLYRLISQRSE